MSTTQVTTQKCAPKDSLPTARPRTDILEDAEGLKLVLDLPGVSQDRCDVKLENGVLEIHGRRADAPTDRVLRRSEVRPCHWYRAFELPENVDVERMNARLENGVLTVLLPRAKEAMPRRIDVQVGG